MAPKQKTFELIPDLPGLGQAQQQRPADATAAVQSKPPMTTKQAKKLYRQKSKGPKLSKAEQRRIDLMEQDRIRKEFEKEKAQARAQAARDKKKAKEDKERDEKRKKGLPLVNVHPSQDTISRFISRLGFGGKNSHLDTVQEADSESATEVESDADVRNEPHEERKDYHAKDHNRNALGKENEDPADAPADSADRPAKRRKLGQPSRSLLDKMIHIPSQRSLGAVARVAQEMEMESWSRPSSIETDDPATEAMLEDQLIADVELASSKSAARSSPNRHSPSREPLPAPVQPASRASLTPRAPSPPPPPPPAHPQPRPQPPRPQNLQGSRLPTGTRIALGDIAQKVHSRAKPKPVEDVFKKPASPFVPGGRQGPAIRGAAATKPPAPPRFKPPPGAVIHTSGRPRFLPQPAKVAPTPVPVQASPTYAGSRRNALKTADVLPTSTQLLVMNHVDELFPSPSQEARELREDQQPAKAAKMPTGQSTLLQNPPYPTDEHINHLGGRKSALAPIRPTPLPRDQAGENAPPEFPFLATQDLILSSQDIEELDTPSKMRPEPATQTLHVASHGTSLPLSPQKLALPSNEKTRFVLGAQAPKDSTDAAIKSSAQAIGSDFDCCRQKPASKNGPDAHGTPPGPTGEVTKCPTQALTRPRSQRLQGFSKESPPSRPTSQRNAPSPQRRSGKHDAVGRGQSKKGFDSRPSFHCSNSPAKNTQSNPSSHGSSAAHQSQKDRAVLPASPPKKRMFGSSGPGAEVLVAMERSYKQNLAEERRRKEELLAQARKTSAEALSEQDLAEIVEDDLLDDETDYEAALAGNHHGLPGHLVSGDMSMATSRLRSPIGMGTNPEANATGRASETRTDPVASQETDYGDFDFDAGAELDMLADITWADDDLSDI